MDYKYHKESIKILNPILKKLINDLPERINDLIDKTMFEKKTFNAKDISELGIRICDINNKFDDNNIIEFSRLGYDIIKYVNSEISIFTLFPFMLGFQISKKRKYLSEQNDIIHRKFMDRELFEIPNNLKKEDIPNEKVVIAIVFYNSMLFSSINNITSMLLSLSKINQTRTKKLINDKTYRKEFIKEIIRIYSPLTSIPRKVDNFDILFTNINTPISWEFDWNLFDNNYNLESEFNAFGFGNRQCIAKKIIQEIYEKILISIITRYKVENCYIRNNKNKIFTLDLAYKLEPEFKLIKI